MIIRILYLLICFSTVLSTHSFSQKKWILNRQMKNLEDKFNNHTGLVLYNPKDKKMLYSYQGDRYFTPASNTKILTLLTSLKVLGDSIPGIYVQESPDSLIIWGTGDPSLLYPGLPLASKSFEYLLNTPKNIYFSADNFKDSHFGQGWAWDDYSYYYQVEKSPMPIYGNYLEIAKDSGNVSLRINNNVFKKYFYLMDSSATSSPIIRDYGTNLIEYFPKNIKESFSRTIPYRYSPELLTDLLSDTLHRKVTLINKAFPKDARIINSIPADSVYKVLMQTSDNFIAEQLLLVCAGILSDTLNSEIAISYAKREFMSDLPQEPLWIDGSGLSRYNLFTPASIVSLWEKIYEIYPQERLFNILAIGGQAGTIRNWYKADSPYIYGKTGTLRNNHSLSGFLLNEDGEIIIFSMMLNNYPTSSTTVKREMEKILWFVHERF